MKDVPMKTIPVQLGTASYEVLVSDGILSRAGKLALRALKRPPTLAIVVTSPRVRRHWGNILEASLRKAVLRFAVVEINDGEKNKNIRTLDRLLARLAALGADRNSVLIAFGGGVVGDTAGFAASIYMRGIPVIQVPTTLLAQVDAAIGGKTGVNLAAGKNMAGTFHQPSLVIADPQVLQTLDAREYRAGIFEVIKCGVIRDARLFHFMETNSSDVLSRESSALQRMISASVKVKSEVVSADERESGLRRILNFGHTIGHALEASSNYRSFLHGEAVGLGMIAAAEIGVACGITPPEDAERIIDCVMSYGPFPIVKTKPANILKLLVHDKKTVGGVPHFVLAEKIGTARITTGVTLDAIRNAVQSLREIGLPKAGKR